jgi:hypothetical protein
MASSDLAAPIARQPYGDELRARISAAGERGFLRGLVARSRLTQELEQLGITRSPTSNAPVWALVALLAVAAGSATIGAALGSFTTQTAVGLAAVVLTVAGLLVAVLQWRHGLSEKAFDGLYQRIAMANTMRLEVFKDLGSDDELDAAARRPELYRFFVFTEIDSLECAAQRFRFGLGMNAAIVDRAVRHFKSRCASEAFRRTAEECAYEGAYFEHTKTTVRAIVDDARRHGTAGRVSTFTA